MAKIITLTNQKGGTGKTTSAVNLGAYLAAKGKLVLLVDLDPQANATSGIGVNPKEISKSLYHLITGQDDFSEIIKKTKVFGLELLPSNQDLAGSTIELINQEEREFKLKFALEKLANNYDYILIDCPPSLGILTINGLVAAQEIIIPVQCEYYALEGLSQLLETINLIKENLEPNLELMGALLTMYDSRNQLSRQVAKEIYRHFPGRVFDAIVPRNVSLAESPSHGLSILEYDSYSKGARAYRQLAEEVIELEKKQSL
jgi:chromosome partitioning protein